MSETLSTQISALEKEYAKLQNDKSVIEKRMTEITNQISELRILQANQNTDSIDNLDLEQPECVVPEMINFGGFFYRDLKSIVWNNLCTFMSDYKVIDINHPHLSCLSELLFSVGRELLIMKTDKVYSTSDQQISKDLIATCEKVWMILYNNDLEGYGRYKEFINQKFGIPFDPFEKGKEPFDFFTIDEDSLFHNTVYLVYYLSHLKKKIEKELGVYWLKNKSLSCDVEIDYSFTQILKALHSLWSQGYTLAIVPIYNKQILNRPKRAAQDSSCMSMLYYADYVDVPTLVHEEDKTDVMTQYQFRSGAFVSGHYRRGHMRNGHWVSGGFVRSHYRR